MNERRYAEYDPRDEILAPPPPERLKLDEIVLEFDDARAIWALRWAEHCAVRRVDLSLGEPHLLDGAYQMILALYEEQPRALTISLTLADDLEPATATIVGDAAEDAMVEFAVRHIDPAQLLRWARRRLNATRWSGQPPE